MPDDIDRAQEREQQIRDAALADQAHRARHRELIPCGHCHRCDEPVRGDALFCNSYCRDDWERDQAARRRNGAT